MGRTKKCKLCSKEDNIVYLCGKVSAETNEVNLSVGRDAIGILIYCKKCKFCPECGKPLDNTDDRVIS